MISQPGFELEIRSLNPDEQNRINAPVEYLERIKSLLTRLNASVSPDRISPVEVTLRACYAQHHGLGSGTQLAMAMVDGWTSFYQVTLTSIADAMRLAGRGERSSIGSTGYFQGGLLIDNGKLSLDSLGVVQARFSVPDEWRVLLLRPPKGIGLAGQAEQDAFSKIDQVRHPEAQRLNRLLEVDIPQALSERDFLAFTSAIDEFGQRVGQQFAQVQGGIYASQQADEIVLHLRKLGLSGIGQSSWGPTLFACCQNQLEAEAYCEKLPRHLPCPDWSVTLTHPMNSAARKSVKLH